MGTVDDRKRSGRVAPPAQKTQRRDDFKVVESPRGLGTNLPQKLGRALWGPMFVMAAMAFPIALILGIVRADAVDTGDALLAEQLRHHTAAVMFIGFMAVFSAITFAIARILGVFRTGGGEVQEAAGVPVQTLRMPGTAKAMVAFMAMGMMVILIPVIAHFVVGAGVEATEASLLDSEQWFAALEGFRRLGAALYLAGIGLGLITIVRVLQFQSIRIREVASLATNR